MDSQAKTDYRPVLADRRRTSPAQSQLGSGPGQLRRQRTAEGSLSPGPLGPAGGSNGRDSRNVFDRLAQDGARRYRALSPPEGRTLKKGGGGYNSDTWNARRSPRTPLGSPTSTTSASNCIEEMHYPRAPYSPTKGLGRETGNGEDASRSRHSPNVSLVKQRRSTSEGARDATLVEIVNYLGDDKAGEPERVPDCYPSQDDYLSDAKMPQTRDPRRPLGRDLQTEVRRLTRQNDQLRKQVDAMCKDKTALELAQDKMRAEIQQLREREKHSVKEAVKEADRDLERAQLEAKALHEKQLQNLKIEHEKEVAKIQSVQRREKVDFKDLIWKLESQLKLDRNAQALLTPGEAARILKIREDTTSARNVELEFEIAMLREEYRSLLKEHQRTQKCLEVREAQMCQMSLVAGAETTVSPKKAAGGGA